MESSCQQPKYTSQLQIIKNIENNLSHLKSRIRFLQNQDNRSSERLEKLFESSIPIIHRKIAESQHLKKVKNFYAQTALSKFEKAEEVKMSRIAQELEINKNKQQIARSKNFDSFHIREMSKKNQKMIDSAKRQWVEEKRKKGQLVKACRIQSRKNVQLFHHEKQNYFRKMRRQQGLSLDKRISQISASLNEMIKVEASESKRYKNNEKVLQKLQKGMSFIQKMKPQAFLQIFNELKLNKSSELNDEIIQAILSAVNQKIEQKQPESNQTNILPPKNTLNRYRSEQSELQNIYGPNYSAKRIR